MPQLQQPSTNELTETTVAEDEAPTPMPIATAPKVEPVAQPVAEEAPAKQAQNYDVIHSNVYNTVGNEAAGSTIGGDMDAICSI